MRRPWCCMPWRSIRKRPALKVLLTHTPQSRVQYYGARSLAGLQALARVKLHESNDALDAAGLIKAARDVDIIVADRLTAGPGEIFRWHCRICAPSCAARSISATSMSTPRPRPASWSRGQGRASCQSVAELALGYHGRPVARRFARDRRLSCRGGKPEIIGWAGSWPAARLGIIGYGSIGRYLADDRQGAGHGGAGRRSLCDRRAMPGIAACARSTICWTDPTLSSVSRSPTSRPKT